MIEISAIDASVSDKSDHSKMGDRILMILRQQKRTKSWLAEEIGVSKQGMNYILSRSSLKFINQIALALDVNPAWLETGEGSAITNPHSSENLKYINLINMQSIPFSLSNVNSIHENPIVVSSSLSNNCFATNLENNSMEPLFRKGSTLIFDPNKSPKNSDYVIFSLCETNEVFFRQYFSENKHVYLKSIDTMYQTIIDNEIKIHGVLVESRNCFS